jgi:hypothetical protein
MKPFTTKSPKVLAATSAALLLALCLIAVVVIAKRQIGPRRSAESAKTHLKSLVVRGTQLREAGQYEEAEPLLQEAVEVAEDTFGPRFIRDCQRTERTRSTWQIRRAI